MKIKYFTTLPSTQKYLIENIKSKIITNQTCIVAGHQSDGIGSRGNKWSNVENGLYFSFNIFLDSLPDDLAPQSMSIFFAFIFKENLQKLTSKVWLKYPNDLYISSNKIGGIICNIIGEFAVCGIGLNIESSAFGSLEYKIDKNIILEKYFKNIKDYTWSKVFAKYSKEFYKNYDFFFHYKDKYLPLRDSTLLEDGSININGEILYSIR
ncbi:biotin--[acetyl-CoA-carboxylase] ligase [Helicobacter sp. MIT 14-3879]|uniref:biotin--[acetyl-CoA-carboxylase] ligase n=1 Tax=Helicobacter sp. MIT 14-3879 TaxID=2040649 RepID=UPI000E1F7561|nr:biotin--[acetyl-CoA-carboxylase] ligase [Helicobacter sp. MIT 14-3879]RDU62416.1 biotin--[acetyl-CoA-carboxylase] ligase [Helicobacter sp. MIT 14-3879]